MPKFFDPNESQQKKWKVPSFFSKKEPTPSSEPASKPSEATQPDRIGDTTSLNQAVNSTLWREETYTTPGENPVNEAPLEGINGVTAPKETINATAIEEVLRQTPSERARANSSEPRWDRSVFLSEQPGSEPQDVAAQALRAETTPSRQTTAQKGENTVSSASASPVNGGLTEKKGPVEPFFSPEQNEKILQKTKRYLRYALRPSELYENMQESLWILFLGGTSLFFGLFYLLVAMDWHQADLISTGRLWAFVFVGLLVGATAALSFAGGTQLLSRWIRKEPLRPFRLLSSVAGAALFPTAVLLFGLLIGLIFGAAVSMSFGVTALLWWIYTLMEVLRDLFPKRYGPILTFLTLWGAVVFIVISLTFVLK